MSYTAIDPNAMRDRLLTLENVREKLEPTDHLSEIEVYTDGSNRVSFNFPETWNAALDNMDDLDVTEATVTVDGAEFPLTKGGALDAVSKGSGVTKSLLGKSPGPAVAPLVDWHYRNGGNGHKTLKFLLGANNNVLGITRGTVEPFGNLPLLDAVLEGIHSKYEGEVMADYKFNHDLEKTTVRLILLDRSHSVGSARAERAGDDPWSLGIDINNSLSGASPLEISGSLFAWWCTNGCSMTHASSGKYRRKPSLTPADAYDWARVVVDDVLGDLEHEFDRIDALTQIPLEGQLNETLGNIFEEFEVPGNLRERVMANLIESDDLTAYGLLNSLTAVANDGDLSGNAVSAVLKAGGDFVHAVSGGFCEACHRF